MKVLLTGKNSMIGRHLYEVLAETKKYDVIPVGKSDYDLTSINDTIQMFRDTRPDYVYNLAGFNGNISFSKKYPADIFYQTSQIALNCLHTAYKFNVRKCVNIISSCAIADLGDKSLKAEELWNGPPNPTIEAHGFAKRVWDAYSRQLFQQFSFNSVCAIVNNCYGEYDNTDIEKTKAVMGIIKRVVEAKRNNLPSIECWGTGNVYREFVYAKDAARALYEVMQNYHNSMCPINISTEDEIAIYTLTYMIADIVGYTGRIKWDTSKPDGQLRKSLDITNMKEYIKFDFTPIKVGLTNTVKWYEENF